MAKFQKILARDDEIVALFVSGKVYREIADTCGVSQSYASKVVKDSGLTASDGGRSRKRSDRLATAKAEIHSRKVAKSHERSVRDKDIVARFKSGQTLQSIGDCYSMTRERIRQIVSSAGISPEEGGLKKTIIDRTAKEAAAKEARCQKVHGCSVAEHKMLQDMSPVGPGRYRSPIGAFINQRSNARARGIEWHIKLWEWWMIWQDSGRWDERGRGNGYVMCRNGDNGPYSVDNVYIATAAQNTQDYYGLYKEEHSLKVRDGRIRAKMERQSVSLASCVAAS